jgi:hypothetical protein
MAIERIERVIDDGRRETMVADTLRADVITSTVVIVLPSGQGHGEFVRGVRQPSQGVFSWRGAPWRRCGGLRCDRGRI